MFYRFLSIIQRQRTSPRWQTWCLSRSSVSAAEAHSVTLPAQAQVVICGGGIMGTSVAYHLSRMGWKDIILLEQGRLAAGSTRFCAGILSTARHLTIEQKMADYSNKLYQQLEQETGIQTGYIRTGSVFLAQTQDRLISLKRINSRLNVIGIPSEIISPKKVAELHPFLNVHNLVGAMHVPEDAVVSSADVALALASAASQNGVQIYDRTSVLHVMVKKGQVTGVETDKGQIECQYFVNCAGQLSWTLMEEFIFGTGRVASCLGALRRTRNLFLLRARTSWKFRIYRKTGIILVCEADYNNVSWGWRYRPVIPAHRKMRQEDCCVFKANLNCILRPCLKQK